MKKNKDLYKGGVNHQCCVRWQNDKYYSCNRLNILKR